MADTHVISALSTKRGEILGSIKHYKQLISSLDKDLQNIDATIKIFEPDYKFGSEKVVNKHTRNRFFNNGEAKVLVLEVLKNSNLPISTDKISDIIATNRNLSFENKTDKSNFQKLYIPINLISITKTFDQLQKIIELVLYLIKLNPNNIFI